MPQNPPHVLLVDDDPAMLRLLSKWLESAGYRVRCAGDGREAILAIDSECPQFLITDLEMPHFSGMDLCRWVRGQNLPGYVYAIILTARSGSGDMVRGLEAGADDFLKKPVNKDELLARMRAGMRVLELESRLSLLAKCDSLTGLFTQRTFFECLSKEWTRSGRHRFPLSCVMVDIDFFKRINDNYGHSVGDEVIRAVAQMLKANTRSSDIVSRYGGEEFCVMLPETTEYQAVLWAERIRRVLAVTPVTAGGKTLQLTASFGAAQRTSDITTPEELVDLADQALLVSKRTGRDRVTAYQTMNDSHRAQPGGERPPVFEGLRACDVMTTIVAGLPQNEKLGRAVEYFLELRINSAPVVDDEGKVVGVLSEKDAMAILLWPRWWETTISDVMKRGVVTYEESTSALVIYEFLCRVAVRSVIVVRDGRPTGVISRASLLRWFTNALLARGADAGLERLSSPDESPDEIRAKLRAVAAKLSEHAVRLERDVTSAADELAPRIVGGVSCIQELANDLLGYSHRVYAESAGSGPNSSFGECAVRGAFALLPSAEGGAEQALIAPHGAE